MEDEEKPSTIEVDNEPEEIQNNTDIDSVTSQHKIENITNKKYFLKIGHTCTDGGKETTNINNDESEDIINALPVVIGNNSRNPLQVQVKLSKQYNCPPGVDTYQMTSKPRGNVLIINNVEFSDGNHKVRFGSLVDSANLQTLFSQLGFDVKVHENLPLNEMRRAIKKHSELESHTEADMGVVCLLSHGYKADKLISSDGELLNAEWVFGKFRSDDCPNLHGKPKLFLIQACRGADFNTGFKESTDEINENFARQVSTDSPKIPNGEDILIVNATVPEFVAHRDKRRGSWFIECFCEVVMEHAFNTDLRDMLDMVADRLRGPKYEDEDGNKQIFEFANRHFRKKLFFNPGLYEDKSKLNQISIKENTPKMELSTIFNKENEVLTNFQSDEEKVLGSLNRLLKVFEHGMITTDQLFGSKITKTLYNIIRPIYKVETQQGKTCRDILLKIQSVIKRDPDYDGEEELPPITPLPTTPKKFKNLFFE